MTSKDPATPPTANALAGLAFRPNDYSPNYWHEAFKGSPTAIFIPQLIRFMQGELALRKALNFLILSRSIAMDGSEPLRELLESLDNSNDSKQTQLSFETVFSAALFVNLVSEVEHFFVSCAVTAIRLYPGKVGRETFRLSDILAATSSDELVERAANQALQDLMYKKPSEYLSDLCEILSIDKSSLLEIWPDFVEMKARRDLGVHNNWVANTTYLRKLGDIDCPTKEAVGSRLIPDFAYLSHSMDIGSMLVSRMANLMSDKWLPKPPHSEKPADSPAPTESSDGSVAT